MTIKEILMACCEKDEEKRYANTVVSVSSGIVSEDGESYKTDISKNIQYMNVDFEYQKSINMFELTIHFRGSMDNNLSKTLDVLNRQVLENKQLDEHKFFQVEFSLLPIALKGQYEVVLVNPIFYALASYDAKQTPSMLKLYFDEEDIVVFEHEGIDYASIVANINREADMEAFLEEQEQKALERERLETERNFYRG